jgi:tetratricopeptide (TPR) repeat protein
MSATGAVEVAARPRADRTRLVSWLFLVLIAILSVELLFCIRRESQTWDEACHIFAGYSYWTRGDFRMNPEHPPLVKLLTTLPLLGLNLRVPEHPKFFSKEEDFTTGTDFLYKNNAEQILFRTRMMAGCLTVLLALVLYCAVRRMFGTGAALIGLFLLVIEPNILAHGMVITTDIGFTCFLFATVYAFYRYVQEPSAGKLVLTGLAAGLALASKHSGILVLPILCLLAACEVLPRKGGCKEERASQSIFRKPGGRLAASVLAIGVIAIITLWAFYGFRSQPRAGINAEAEVIAYAGQLKHPFQTRIISEFTNWHLLPQAYLYGLTDVEVTAEFSHSYILGTIYPHGKWFYFPIAFVIKTTVALMLLLLFVPFLARKHPERRREWIFLSIPPVVYFIVAMSSGMNIGVRHILPVYPFLFALGGWAAWTLMQRSRAWAYAIACLLLFSLISSARAFPVYLAYSNELWGGPASTYKYLSDSNADWGQQLKATKRYLDARHVDHCWFAYFADVVTDPTYYGIPCKPLTTIASVWLQPSIDVPAKIDGPVLISSSVLTGYEFGPGSLNPYEQFLHLQPTAVIEDGIFVFDGNFEIPLAAARNHVTQAQLARHANQMERALSEAQTAATLAPHSVPAQAELGDVLSQLKRTEEAHQAYEKALLLAQTEYPEFQAGWVSGLKQALKEKQ